MALSSLGASCARYIEHTDTHTHQSWGLWIVCGSAGAHTYMLRSVDGQVWAVADAQQLGFMAHDGTRLEVAINTIDPLPGGELFAGGRYLRNYAPIKQGDGFVGISRDMGVTWTWMGLPRGMSPVSQVASLGRNKLGAATSNGLYVSRDMGLTWTECTNRIARHQVFTSIYGVGNSADPSAPLSAVAVGVTLGRALILYTDDGGETWKEGRCKGVKGLNSVVYVPYSNGEGGGRLEGKGGRMRARGEEGGGAFKGSEGKEGGWVAVGDGGVMVSSWDGGAEWARETTNTEAALKSVTVTKDEDGAPVIYASGFHGILLRGGVVPGVPVPLINCFALLGGGWEQEIGPHIFEALAANGNAIMAFGACQATGGTLLGSLQHGMAMSENGGFTFQYRDVMVFTDQFYGPYGLRFSSVHQRPERIPYHLLPEILLTPPVVVKEEMGGESENIVNVPFSTAHADILNGAPAKGNVDTRAGEQTRGIGGGGENGGVETTDAKDLTKRVSETGTKGENAKERVGNGDASSSSVHASVHGGTQRRLAWKDMESEDGSLASKCLKWGAHAMAGINGLSAKVRELQRANEVVVNSFPPEVAVRREA